jgi:hypothetical protein
MLTSVIRCGQDYQRIERTSIRLPPLPSTPFAPPPLRFALDIDRLKRKRMELGDKRLKLGYFNLNYS